MSIRARFRCPRDIVFAAALATASLSAQCATTWLPGAGIPGTNGTIDAIASWDPDCAGPLPPVLVLAGSFKIAGTKEANAIATWDPVAGTWATLGAGLTGTLSGEVLALAILPWRPRRGRQALTTLPNGDLVAAGNFLQAGSGPATFIARWDGTSWSPLGTGLNAGVYALATMPNGDVVAGGYFNLAGGANATNIARWNGTSWSPLGSGVSFSAVNALCVLPNGDVIAGGNFPMAGGVIVNHIARWNGSSWSALGAGLPANVLALTTLPNGDVLAGIDQAPGLMRWDGTVWLTPAGGTDSGVTCMALAGTEVAVGGWFLTAGGALSVYFARLATGCPAAAAATGVGCASSGGGNTLSATTLPWVGATFRAQGAGLPNLAFVVAASSLTAIPQGVAPLQSFHGPDASSGAGTDVAELHRLRRASSLASMKSIVLLVALLVPCSGCLFGSKSKVEYQGRHVTDDQMLRIQQGVSEAEVLEVLGEPSNKSDLGDAAALWKWHYTRRTESTHSVFLLLASESQVSEPGTVYVRFEKGRVAKVWRTEA